jgi:hypothetical protein
LPLLCVALKAPAACVEHLQVKTIGEELGIGFLGVGFDPKWRIEDIPGGSWWVDCCWKEAVLACSVRHNATLLQAICTLPSHRLPVHTVTTITM